MCAAVGSCSHCRRPRRCPLSISISVLSRSRSIHRYAAAHNIHLVSFSSLSESETDLPTLQPAVGAVAAAHNATPIQIMYAYVALYNITVLSSYDPTHPQWLAEDLAIFDVVSKLTLAEVKALDKVTTGTRTCTWPFGPTFIALAEFKFLGGARVCEDGAHSVHLAISCADLTLYRP